MLRRGHDQKNNGKERLTNNGRLYILNMKKCQKKRRTAQIRRITMDYEILQMEIVPLATLTATAASITNGGRTPVPGNLP